MYYRLVNAASQESGLRANNKLCIGKKSIKYYELCVLKMFFTKPIRLSNTVFICSGHNVATRNVQRGLVISDLENSSTSQEHCVRFA